MKAFGRLLADAGAKLPIQLGILALGTHCVTPGEKVHQVAGIFCLAVGYGPCRLQKQPPKL